MGWFGGYVIDTVDQVPGNQEILPVSTGQAYFSRSKIKPTSGTFAGMSAQTVLVSLEGGDIRFRIDGLNATTTIGHVMNGGDCLAIKGTQAINQFRAVRLGDADGSLQVTYFY
jgi:hypothetical protein